MNLLDFTNIQELSKWITKNVQSLPIEDDNIFIPFDKILNNKYGNCLDLALLYHSWFQQKNIKHGIFQIGLYKEDKDYQIGRYHICSFFKEKNYYIVQNLLTEHINKEIFLGNNSLIFSLKKFANQFFADYKQMTGLIDGMEVLRILSNSDINKLDNFIKRNDILDKQTKFFSISNRRKNILAGE